MFYPEFLKPNDTIGICAPSAGAGDRLEDLEISIDTLTARGYRVRETGSVRELGARSASAEKRAAELDELVTDPDVKLIICASGGDYMFEMVPYINFEHIAENPKWIAGKSDPTNLLYPVTAGLDIAALYGHNATGITETDPPKRVFMDMISGALSRQNSYPGYQTFLDTIRKSPDLDKDVKWVPAKPQTIEGRLIGGCFEAIEKFLGTPYDHAKAFIEKYKSEGIVWFFDIFNMSSYRFYLSLLQMKYAGYFSHCAGVLIGRVAFPSVEDPELDYLRAADLALGNIPHIMEMDLGHTNPGMTIINGALVKAESENGKGSLEFSL